MRPFRFWYNESDQVLHVIDGQSGKQKQLTQPKKISAFLEAYELQLSDLCGVYEVTDDRLRLFRKWLGGEGDREWS